MNARKRTSKKRSDANSRPQPELTLFLDRILGKHVIADRLRSEGITVEMHDDHLPPDAPDEDWISLVGRKNWLAVTKDKNVRYRAAELDAIRRHSARVIVIRMKNATGPEIADLLVKARNRIGLFAERTSSPFVAGISRSGVAKAYEIL